MEDLGGGMSDPEVLEGLEAIVDWKATEDLRFTLAGYYNNYELLGFSRADTTTKLVGTLETMGGEAEGKWSSSRVQVGASHSLLKQLDFRLAAEFMGSGISYADFHPTLQFSGDTLVIEGYGNHLNNWPE